MCKDDSIIQEEKKTEGLLSPGASDLDRTGRKLLQSDALAVHAWKDEESVLLRLENEANQNAGTTIMEVDLNSHSLGIDPETERFLRFYQFYSVHGNGPTKETISTAAPP